MDEPANRAIRSFQTFYAELVKVLPISDLLPEFVTNHVLSSGQKAALESRNTRKEKTEYFLDEVIKRGLDVGYTEQFNKTINIMESCDDHVTRFLAKQIKGDLEKGTNNGTLIHICT